MSLSFRKSLTFYTNRNNLLDLFQSLKKLNVIVLTVLFLDGKNQKIKAIL